ncbi:hypothetical protein KB553_01705 [Chryseobacterium rhizoplanae]|uniref:hypothetical protein n=1 Tax=Chryseobacterium rhizoplanae TaxID=1609531 RepID=UPI001CE27CE2|nr:hypothetical protein [Chryseobacterium rhizoplanae]UCA60254.1 hypothetical protein KB553_01705 [Chryseobacterium rhizoplanae]
MSELFDHYPSLIQKYGVKELFSGNANIPNFSQKSLKIAGLLTCIQFLIPSCKEFSDRSGNMAPFVEIPNNNSFKPIKYIIGSISKDDFIEDLFILLISVVGTDYYKKFIKKTGSSNFTTEDILILNEDPELQEYIDLMAWFALIRLFLESVYFYFNPENHNLKNPLQ